MLREIVLSISYMVDLPYKEMSSNGTGSSEIPS